MDRIPQRFKVTVDVIGKTRQEKRDKIPEYFKKDDPCVIQFAEDQRIDVDTAYRDMNHFEYYCMEEIFVTNGNFLITND